MKIKQFPINSEMYLAKELQTITDELSDMKVNLNYSFQHLFVDIATPIADKLVDDCYNNHLNDIAPYLADTYDSGERYPTFADLIHQSILEYLFDKIINNISTLYYNSLISYVNNNALQWRVSYDMVDIIASNASEYTSPQELIDNLHSFLDS